MKISEIYNLDKTQHELDFVDIDPGKDKSVFIDPFFISTREHVWCIDANRTTRSFFQYAIDLISNDNIEEAKKIFIHLNEPNETCLGLSRSEPQGRGVGPDDSERIFNSILKSEAVKTGLVDDLEDTAIFIDGIDKDKVSDMTTNIIRKHLIEYTKNQCELWDIPLEKEVPTGFYWESSEKEWQNNYTDRLVIDDKPILLVPKIAVSYYKYYTNQKYYQHDVLNFLKGWHLKNRTSLVQTRTLKDGSIKEFVTKEVIKEKDAPFSKKYLRNFTRKHPKVFEKFKEKTKKQVKPIKNKQLEDIDIKSLVDFLVKQLETIDSGSESSNTYHNLIIGILELIFYPKLTNPIKEKDMHEGRKRVDITFDNAATSGFFHRLHDVHNIPSSYIFVECKNYSEDPNNPEIDQLSGRLSAQRGKFGILVCRKIDNVDLFIKRCRDLWKQKGELIFPLTDGELVNILKNIKKGNNNSEEELLKNLQREVILA